MMGKDSTKPHFMETALQVLAYKIPKDPVKGPWVPEVLNEEMHVAHNFRSDDGQGLDQAALHGDGLAGVGVQNSQRSGERTVGSRSAQRRDARGPQFPI